MGDSVITRPAYYNEIDPYAAQWLRNQIKAGLIAPGDVDTRSIEDVKPDDLRPYTQWHFFAGIGGWSHALRRAGWDDSRPVCTMSCPCQPFSAAGAGNGFADERHLWPSAYHLIGQLRFKRIYGEQVASKAVDDWIDLVHADLEALGYAFGSVPFPSAGVGAPHIRDRNYWMADAMRAGRPEWWPGSRFGQVTRGGEFVHMGDASGTGLQERERIAEIPGRTNGRDERQAIERAGIHFSGMAHADGRPDGGQSNIVTRANVGGLAAGDGGSYAGHDAAGPTNGLWRDADWLLCRDGKWRPVEPGTFPLANGVSGRTGRLRAYGNAINVEAAAQFIMATADY